MRKLFTPKTLKSGIASALILTGLSLPTSMVAQTMLRQLIRTQTPNETLKNLAINLASEEAAKKAMVLKQAKAKGWVTSFQSGKTTNYLVDIDELGNPVYAGVDNLTSAVTIAIDKVWPGGSTNYNLSGRGMLSAQWDGGGPRTTHVELRGGRVINADNSGLDDHATHVAGTISGKGVDPQAKGMAYEVTHRGYSSGNNPLATMPVEANRGAVAGNHSWSYKRGFQASGFGYSWLGPANTYGEDPGFGYYSSISRQWDQVALAMPYYLNCKSAGNDRGAGPNPGETYTVQATGATVTQPAVGSATYRPKNGPYGCQANHSVSKNLLTVAAVNAINNGYNGPNSVVMSSFSSWGPTDDGRIKPDVSAVGVNVYSSVATSDNSYDNYDGTSMATPSMTGACVLVQEQYANTHKNRLMKAETLKGLIIHTADEAGGNAGPDYAFGWGLANIKRACDVIMNDSVTDYIKELSLSQGQTITIPVTLAAAGPLKATISWFDQPGIVDASMPLNDRTPKLVNDLDLRIVRLSDNTTFQPWVLDPAAPSAAATRADNFRDNVEQVFPAGNMPAGQYEIRISHKGNLTAGPQSFGLIVSGIQGPNAGAVCRSLHAYSASTGTVTDGSGSASYKPNTDCAWEVDVQDTTSALSLTFTALDLSAGDTIYVYSGNLANRTLLGKYTGNTIPAAILYGSKGRAYIRFVSDGNNEGAGFAINYRIQTLPQITANSTVTEICSGDAIRLNATTTVASDTTGMTWQWSIPGAIPNNPTGRTPVVMLPNSGTYNASVIGTNFIGSSNATLTTPIKANNGNLFMRAYAEERFDANTSWPRNTVDTNGNWRVTSFPASNTNWSRSTLAAYSGNAAAYIRNNTVLDGTERNLISPNFDLRGLTQGQRIRFRISSAKAVTSSNDELRLFYSTNCGASWSPLSYTRTASSNPSIYTVSALRSYPFVPTGPSEWRLESVAIPTAAINAQKVQFRWQYINTARTSLYLDDIMIGDSALSIRPGQLQQVYDLVTVYPNPSTPALMKAKINLPAGTDCKLVLTDMLGRTREVVYTTSSEDEVIQLADFFGGSLPRGLYAFSLQREYNYQSLKLVVE